MLKSSQLPTRLVADSERSTVNATPIQRASFLRAARIIGKISRFLLLFLLMRIRQSTGNDDFGDRLRHAIEDLGVLWLKAGQILSTRADLLPRTFSDALSRLSDRGAGVPFSDIRKTIEAALNAPLDTVYEEFEKIPFAAFSTAQLHRAFLRREQRWVAVKVHKPNAEQLVAQDQSIARWVAKFLVFFSILPRLRWEELLEQAEDLAWREMDLRYEEYSLRRLKKKLRRHKIYVPDTFRAYSGKDVLVMEFIHAALMSDYIRLQQTEPERLARWLTENNIDPSDVATRLHTSVFRQIFEDNLFHADMHPANIVLLRDSDIAVIDCRSMGSLEADLLDRYRMCMQAIAQQRYASAADIYLLLASHSPPVDVTFVKADLIRVWRRWHTDAYLKGLAYEEKSTNHMFNALNRVVFDNQFAVRWPLSRMSRALANMDASLEALDPEMNPHRKMQKYFIKAKRRSDRKKFKALPQQIPQSMLAFRQLPRQAEEFSLFQKSILRRQAQSIQGSTSIAGRIISVLFGSLSWLFLLIGITAVAALVQNQVKVPLAVALGPQLSDRVAELPELGFTTWVAIALAGCYGWLLMRRKKKHFANAETAIPSVHAAV